MHEEKIECLISDEGKNQRGLAHTNLLQYVPKNILRYLFFAKFFQIMFLYMFCFFTTPSKPHFSIQRKSFSRNTSHTTKASAGFRYHSGKGDNRASTNFYVFKNCSAL